jgi:hypothetical protein
MNNIFSDLHELPAFNWFRATETKNLTWLLKDRTKKCSQSKLEQVFQDLNDQLIDLFGISDNYLNYMLKLRAYNIAKAKWLLSDNNFDKTMMLVAQQQLEEIAKQFGESKNVLAEKINAERILGFRIDVKQISVVEYYNYLNEADKIAKQMMQKK